MEILQIPATIESVSTRADNTLKIVIGSQELRAETSAQLFTLKGLVGWFLFSPNSITQEQLPQASAEEFRKQESPYKELNSAAWVYWDKMTDRSVPFNEFVRRYVKQEKAKFLENIPK